MRESVRAWRILVVATVFVGMVGCEALFGPETGEDTGDGASSLMTRFVEQGASSSVQSSRYAQASPEDDTQNASQAIDALYFGELEIVAYHHRPGEEIQTDNFSMSDDNNDWSHLVPLQSGHFDARDILLQESGSVDFAEFDDGRSSRPSSEYVEEVGDFDIDLFEVNVYRTGVIIDDEYFGQNAENDGLERHPMHRYPDLDGIPDHYAPTRFAGFPESDQTTNVIFARDDWFPKPVLVQLEEVDRDDGMRDYEVVWSSDALTDEQNDLLVSMAEGGTHRRFYTNLVIIPYEGPKTIDLSAGEELTVEVGFEFQDVVDLEKTSFEEIRDDDGGFGAELFYTADEDYVPFGLTVSFD